LDTSSSSKKIIKWAKDALIISLVTLGLAEGALRVMGYRPYHFPPFSIVAEPATTLVPHAEWGLALRPGKFTVTMNEALTYHATHLPDSLRGPAPIVFDTLLDLENIHFYGCSFTYGMGVDDEETFSHLLQQKTLSRTRIRNLGVPGHGTLQSYLRLRAELSAGRRPNRVFLCYAAFHDERNVLSPHYREHLHYGFLNMSPAVSEEFSGGTGADFPYGQLSGDSLVIQAVEVTEIFKPLPLRESSALVNLVQSILLEKQHAALDGEAVTLAIIQKMQALCQAEGIPFTVLSITGDADTKAALARFKEAGIPVFDMGIDIGSPRYNNHPHDSHPNPLAHRIYADSLLDYLRRRLFTMGLPLLPGEIAASICTMLSLTLSYSRMADTTPLDKVQVKPLGLPYT
jgi:hypothetical protein